MKRKICCKFAVEQNVAVHCEKNETNDNGEANHSGGKFSPNVPKTDQTIFIDEVVVTP